MKATTQVATFLREQKKDLEQYNPGKVALIDQVLSYSIDGAWANLIAECPTGRAPEMSWTRWQLVVDRMLDVARSYKPASIAGMEDARRRIAEKNDKIADAARGLAKLLRERSALRVNGDISVPEDTLSELLQSAANLNEHYQTGPLFAHYVAPSLQALEARYDGKYWPDMSDVFIAFAEAHEVAEAVVQDPIGAAGTQLREVGFPMFYRAMDKALDQLAAPYYVGARVRLSDSAYAAICNALLGLDDVITADAVGMYRFRATHHATRQQLRAEQSAELLPTDVP